jgi:starvation-inducible outer membrane lipoprotein
MANPDGFEIKGLASFAEELRGVEKPEEEVKLEEKLKEDVEAVKKFWEEVKPQVEKASRFAGEVIEKAKEARQKRIIRDIFAEAGIPIAKPKIEKVEKGERALAEAGVEVV